MRPRNQIARDQLMPVLARLPGAGAAELARQLAVSVPTLHRLLAELGPAVIRGGRARRARYALRRPLRGSAVDLPLYEIDVEGQASQVGALACVHPSGSMLTLAEHGWPVPEASADGWWRGLPYPLYDMCPHGYMGRQLARAEHRRLEVPDDPRAWSDDDVLVVLTRAGSDLPGNLILGDPAFDRWQQARLASARPLDDAALPSAYVAMAEQALSTGVPGSSAAGEFPKFTALRHLKGSATPHVLVKFSGADDSAGVRRWSDLLVCEHLALEAVGTLPGVTSARTRILIAGGRTFLEVERFDRHGLHGRSRLVSLEALTASLLGVTAIDWTTLADRLAAAGLLPDDGVRRVRLLWWFGRLIANTDMHLGNLSFEFAESLEPAPAYDMLPMLFAPLPGGEVPAREFAPPLPRPQERELWMSACGAAIDFWRRAAGDPRIGESFRMICTANAERLADVAGRV